MPKIKYQDFNFKPERLEMIRQANIIISDLTRQGFDLTLRQLFYQFVKRNWLANTMKEYSRLGDLVNDARLAGMIDWNHIVDRTRNVYQKPKWESPSDILEAVANQYRIDKWDSQDVRVEVWIEKQALEGVFRRVCDELQVPLFCCRGYTSQSEMWAGAMRMQEHIQNGKTPYILHFGDHDPSGIDMSRDIIDRMNMFMGGVDFQRLALNMEQVEHYSPPPNPAKLTDSRASGYVMEYGYDSWELDALDPPTLAGLVRDSIIELRDDGLWEAALAEENESKALLGKISDNWDEVSEYVEETYPDEEDDE